MSTPIRACQVCILAILLTGCASREPAPGDKGFSTVRYLMTRSATGLSDACLVPHPPTVPLPAKTRESSLGPHLPFNPAAHWSYIEKYCAGGNDCPRGEYESDCAHFQAHALTAAGVTVSSPSAACEIGNAIRVKDLAIAFDNASIRYANVWKFHDWRLARRGDFCFLARSGSGNDHLMLLAATPTADDGAVVYAHTNHRQGTFVNFDLDACVFYRIVPR